MSNARTVRAYESYASRYAENTAGPPKGMIRESLDHFASVLGAGAKVLEIGSGPGWDADYLETLGVEVQRTDVTAAFRELQAARGKDTTSLDALHDDLGGPHEAVMALCVLQHFKRDEADGVLQRVAQSLAPGGLFLVSVPEGEGEAQEGEAHEGQDGDYYVLFWKRASLEKALSRAGLAAEWHVRQVYEKSPWFTVLARKAR